MQSNGNGSLELYSNQVVREALPYDLVFKLRPDKMRKTRIRMCKGPEVGKSMAITTGTNNCVERWHNVVDRNKDIRDLLVATKLAHHQLL